MRKCENCKFYTGVQCHGHGDFWGNCTLIQQAINILDPKYKTASVWAEVTSGECRILKSCQAKIVDRHDELIKDLRRSFSYFDIELIVHALEAYDTSKEICESIVEQRRIAMLKFYNDVKTNNYTTYNKENKQ